MEFHADAPRPGTGGDVRLFANGNEIGKGRMDHSVPSRFSGYAGMDIGRDNGGVVDRAHADRAPFTFTGTIKKVVFDIKRGGGRDLDDRGRGRRLCRTWSV